MLEQLTDLLMEIPGESAFGIVILVLLLCGFGLPLPEEIPLIAAGYLAHHGVVSFQQSLAWCMVAIVGGDCGLFGLGYHFGQRIFSLPLFQKLLTPRRMARVNDYFHRYGSRVVFVARFMAGVRATVFLTAGVLRMPFRRFFILDTLAACLSVPLLIWVAYHFGDNIDNAILAYRKTGRTLLLVVTGAVILISFVYYFRRKRSLKA